MFENVPQLSDWSNHNAAKHIARKAGTNQLAFWYA
jgi:hypothetical protein